MKISKYAINGVAFLICMLFVLVSVSWGVESASEYRPIYPSGFKNAHDPNAVDSQVSSGILVDEGNLEVKYWLLRFYIPPAANGAISLALFCQQNANVGVVARLGAPPQCDISTYNTNEISGDFYSGLPWDDRDASLAELRQNDVRISNGAGTISILKDYHCSSTGEWLFVKVLFDGTSIQRIAGKMFDVQIDVSEYKSWYENASWDSSGNPELNVNTSIAQGDCNFESNSNPVDTSYYSISVSQNGSGYITPSGSSVQLKRGESQRFEFSNTPFGGVALEGKIQAGPAGTGMSDMGVGTSYTFVNVQQDMQLYVDFSSASVTGYKKITVNINGSGTVTESSAMIQNGGSVSVEIGGSKVFNFTPTSGWKIKEVNYGSVDYGSERKSLGAVDSCTISNVQEDMILYVEFEKTSAILTYTISVTTSGSGTVYPPGPVVTVNAGESQKFDFFPAGGWEVGLVTYGAKGGSKNSENGVQSYTFPKIQADMELDVVFIEQSREPTTYNADESFPRKEIPIELGQVLNFAPVLEFANPLTGAVNCYAGYICDGKLFMGRTEMNGNVVFIPYSSEVGLLKYGACNIQGGTVWEPDFFVNAQLKTDLICSPDVQFFLIAAPADGLSAMQGCIFQFVAAQ